MTNNLRRRVAVATGALAGAIAVSWTFAWAYYHTFSRFLWYDDEGYVMTTVRQVIHGRALYDEVYSQYGPFYYVLRVPLIGVLGGGPTHDLTRIVTVACWTAGAVLLATFVFRMSRSAIMALACYLAVFHHMAPMADEPGHPQELCVLLLAGAIAVCAWWNTPETAPRLAVAFGLITPSLLLTKINVGLYLITGLLLSFSILGPRPRSTALTLATGAGALLPWLVMRDHVTWAFGYAAITSLAIIGVSVAAASAETRRALGSRALQCFAAAAVGTTAAICVTVIVMGTSLTALVDGVLFQPLGFASIFFNELRVPPAAIGVAVVSLFLSIMYAAVMSRNARAVHILWLFWSLKLAAGILGLWFAAVSPLALLALGPSCLWLALARPLAPSWQYDQLLPRVVLVAIAVFQSLQAFPVTGSQVAWATVMMVPVAFLTLSDAIGELFAIQPSRHRPLTYVDVTSVAVLPFLLTYVLRTDVVAARDRYWEREPLSLPGALRIRLSPEHVTLYRWIVDEIHARCETFISLPGFNSLYFWAEVEPPTTLNATAWQVLLGREQQQRIVDALRARTGVCVIENPAGVRTFGRDAVVRQQPLWRFVRDDFASVSERGGYRVLMRTNTAVGRSPNPDRP